MSCAKRREKESLTFLIILIEMRVREKQIVNGSQSLSIYL